MFSVATAGRRFLTTGLLGCTVVPGQKCGNSWAAVFGLQICCPVMKAIESHFGTEDFETTYNWKEILPLHSKSLHLDLKAQLCNAGVAGSFTIPNRNGKALVLGLLSDAPLARMCLGCCAFEDLVLWLWRTGVDSGAVDASCGWLWELSLCSGGALLRQMPPFCRCEIREAFFKDFFLHRSWRSSLPRCTGKGWPGLMIQRC